jgi:DNA modification methylase
MKRERSLARRPSQGGGLFSLPELASHPARFSKALEPLIVRWLTDEQGPVFDPFGGTGGVHVLARRAGHDSWASEIEPEWAAWHPCTFVADATSLPLRDGCVGTVVTSPAYGNRMADQQGSTPRRAYADALQRPLHRNNGGGMKWGQKYRQLHEAVWDEMRRVLRPGGALILNCSDFVRKGEVVPVTQWHVETLGARGFVTERFEYVETPRYGWGASKDQRLPGEYLFLLRRA